MRRTLGGAPVRIAGIYAAFGMAWIVLSDRALVWLGLSPAAMVTAQTWKGWAFVLASALLVYLLSRQTMHALRDKVQALSDSERRFRLLFSDNPQPMLVAAQDSQEVIDANTAARRLFGHANPTALPCLRDMIHPDDRERFDEVFERYGRDGGDGEGRWRMLAADGRTLLTDLVSRPAGSAGRSQLVLVSDVTAQVAAEGALLDATRQLERSTSEIQELSQAAAHELQQPLRAVVSHLQLLQRRLPTLDTEAREYVTFAVEGALRMKSCVDDILQITGMLPEAVEEIDMGQVLEGVIERLRPALLETGAAVAVGPMPKVPARRRHVALLLQHLLDNAIKFHHPDRAPDIRVTARRDGDFWLFAVADNGIGIPPEHHLGIFGMFRRAHNSEAIAGNGIGLAICRKIVEQHGGSIEVASRPSEGSTFTFALPTVPADWVRDQRRR